MVAPSDGYYVPLAHVYDAQSYGSDADVPGGGIAVRSGPPEVIRRGVEIGWIEHFVAQVGCTLVRQLGLALLSIDGFESASLLHRRTESDGHAEVSLTLAFLLVSTRETL